MTEEAEATPLYYWGTGRRKSAVARVRLNRRAEGTQHKAACHAAQNELRPSPRPDRFAGQAGQKMQAHPHHEQAGPADELHVAMELDVGLKAGMQRHPIADDEGHVRPDPETGEQRQSQSRPDEASIDGQMRLRESPGRAIRHRRRLAVEWGR